MSTETVTYNDGLITANTEQILANQSLVYEAGKKAEHNKFWDNYQNYGNRVVSDYLFSSAGWNNDNFKPKYDIVYSSAYMMFASNGVKGSLTEILRELNISLSKNSTSNSPNMEYMFRNCNFTQIPPLDVTNVERLNYTFSSSAIVTVDGLIVNENTGFLTTCFTNCTALENFAIEGTIGKNGFNVQWSTKLSGASIVSIIEALSDTTSGLTVTLSQTAVDNMVFPITGNKGTYNSWTDLEQSKINWTISLV